MSKNMGGRRFVRWNRRVVTWVIIGVALPIIGLRAEPVVVESKEALIEASKGAKPGTVIHIAPGTYPGGLYFSDLKGTEKAPIVIEAADQQNPPLFSAESGGNSAMQLTGSSFVTLRNLRITGFPSNGINADDGGEARKTAAGLHFENLVIENTGPRGNHDGLKLSGLTGFVVRNCTFRGWGGSGIDMVGCHNGIIEGCRFNGLPGFSQSNGVQIKGGSSDIHVTKSLFQNPGGRGINLGGSTGLPYFRPADATWEARDIEVSGNRFIGGLAPIAWVGIEGGNVHHNTIYRPEKWVGRILQENTDERFGRCQRGRFEHNLIVFDTRVRIFFNIGANTNPDTFTFHGNAWYGIDNPERIPQGLPVAETGSVLGVDPELDLKSEILKIQSKDPRFKGIGAER